MLAKMIPSDFVGCLGSAPEDLEATRAFFAKFVTNPPVPGTNFTENHPYIPLRRFV